MYYKNHKENIIENDKQYDKDNKNHVLQIGKQWIVNNKEHFNEIKRIWTTNNKEKIAKYQKQYHADKQIQKLSELRKQGILTEEEFKTKKTELLAKM